ncbi:response regulator transcription factor [Diplocloster agilis]|uniref:Stage 0 sporulation protein A homolog n=1 Tax=Diplocloster agilis TaxID=2850323 RepID=A0A949K0S2_9FIRM|nr:response regulator [Diplocloster agilis]MBU9737786.1 response regulator [Diplocloster agilis]
MRKTEITVIIAEDEPIILNNIAKKVENTDPRIQVIGKAQNGRETLALLNGQVPDLLITDIEMPGMNGLELIREVRRLYPQVHILILSGYSNFEYARTAIKYGVDDYLLKPISQSDLSAILTKMTETILSERRQLERNILSKTLHGDSPEILSPSSFPDENFLMVLVHLGNLPSRYAALIHPANLRDLWEQIDFNTFFSAHAEVDHTWIIDEANLYQKFIILHITDREIRPALMAMQLNNFVLESGITLPYHILFHTVTIGYPQIWETARDMRTALPQYVSMYAQNYSLYPEGPKCPLPDHQQKRDHINFLYQLQNDTSYLQYVTTTLDSYAEAGYPQSITDDFIREAYHALPVVFKVDDKSALAAMSDTLSHLNTCETREQMNQQLRISIENMLQTQSTASGSEHLYHQLKHYIEVNYNQKISLDDLSDRYGYTPSYINRLFKKECGLSPLQYQTSLRIAKAKELLSTQADIDIKTIASTIGYDDSRYFSRVFKNEVGTTPSEWVRDRN